MSIFRKTIIVAENQIAYLLRNKQFERVLTPGKHRIFDIKNEVSFEIYDTSLIFYTEKQAKNRIRQYPEIAALLENWILSQNEVGLFYLNNQLKGVVAPGEQLMVWKQAGEVRLERIDITNNYQLSKALLAEIGRMNINSTAALIKSAGTRSVAPVYEAVVRNEQKGLLYIDGQFSKVLEPGHYGFWQLLEKIEVKVLDTNVQLLEVSGQEILTKDRVSLRLNLTANIQVSDVEKAAQSVSDVYDYVYKSIQLALREAVGTRSLDDILIDKLYVNETVRELVADELEKVGVTLVRVGVKDIILPGEMKTILNQVVEAQKAAEANVIKRREETAATRSLHNTAKMMENNPTLLRLKELESLEKIAERVDKINVYGGLEGLMKGTVSIS